MNDMIIQGMAADHQVRFFAASTRNLVEAARSIHNTSPVATAALGRLLTAGALMGSMCKNETDVLTLQIQCSGPIGGLTVTSNAHAQVKGYANNPGVMLPPSEKGKLDVGRALDMGVLSVIKDIGLKEPYIGQSELVSGEIAEDLTYYYAASEQIPTSVALGVLMEKSNTVQHAGGFIIQLMPYADEQLITDLEGRLKEFSSITALMEQGMTPMDMMRRLFEGYAPEQTGEITPEYRCDCSRERVYQAVMSVGQAELSDMLREQKPVDVSCHFCNRTYTFQPEDIERMLHSS